MVWESNLSDATIYIVGSSGKEVRRLTTHSVVYTQRTDDESDVTETCVDHVAPLATVGGCPKSTGPSDEKTGEKNAVAVDMLVGDLYVLGVSLSLEKLKPMPLLALAMYSSQY